MLDVRQEEQPPAPIKPYSIFTPLQKRLIVAQVSAIGLFSPLTANIFVPALPVLTSAFHESTETINLTISLYLVFQGLSPTIWGSLADVLGRRPIYLSTMSIYIISCISIALVPASEFWALLLLRIIQAIGGASVIAIGAGVVADISQQSERGGFMGWYSLGNMFAPAIGPVLGGILSQYLGWRAIFWFLVIACTTVLIPLAFFLPETLRTIVGDGSIPPPTLNEPFFTLIRRRRKSKKAPSEITEDIEKVEASTGIQLKTFRQRWAELRLFGSLQLLFNIDLFMMLFYTSLFYMEFYCVLTATSSLFKSIYGLSEVQIGLCYLSNGAGCIIGSVSTGKILDWDYAQIRKKLPEGTPPLDFPLEKARLKRLPIMVVISHLAFIGFGWALEVRTSLAVPVVLHFFIGYTNTAMMLITQTIVVDLFPGRGSAVTASFNLIRCSLGAVGTSTIDLMIRRLNVGWSFVLLSGICLAASPLPWLILKLGPERRRGRAEEKARKEAGQSLS